MFRTPAVKGLLAAAFAASAAAAFAAPKDNAFTVAVLRRDGMLIPFASYSDRTWSVPWPGTSLSAPLPISLEDVPKSWWGRIPAAAPWKAWLAEGETRPLRLLKPVQVPVFCGAHLAISTDYRGAAPAEREPTVPKDGIATAGDVVVEPITQVSVNAPDAAKIVESITEKFNSEEELAAAHFTRWTHPYGAASRARRPIELEAFYRSSETSKDGPFRTSYIEAVRRYPALAGDEGCGLVTFARGWVTEVPGKKPVINLGVRITYCDRAEVSFIQPFGRVHVAPSSGRGFSGATTFWIYQFSSWREEYYSVAAISPDGAKPVLLVAGGACPKEPPR